MRKLIHFIGTQACKTILAVTQNKIVNLKMSIILPPLKYLLWSPQTAGDVQTSQQRDLFFVSVFSICSEDNLYQNRQQIDEFFKNYEMTFE